MELSIDDDVFFIPQQHNTTHLPLTMARTSALLLLCIVVLGSICFALAVKPTNVPAKWQRGARAHATKALALTVALKQRNLDRLQVCLASNTPHNVGLLT
jgi:hypothetical protein